MNAAFQSQSTLLLFFPKTNNQEIFLECIIVDPATKLQDTNYIITKAFCSPPSPAYLFFFIKQLHLGEVTPPATTSKLCDMQELTLHL